MTLIFRYTNGVECWFVDGQYFVYGTTTGGDARICPSEGMAREVAAL